MACFPSCVPYGCPCGYFGTRMRKCRCTPNQIERYMSKISGPLLDRMDIHIEVPPVEFRKLRAKRNGSGSKEVRELVRQAMAEFALSARAHDKICKVARTIADLEGSRAIQPEHIAEAIGYRKLDRKL